MNDAPTFAQTITSLIPFIVIMFVMFWLMGASSRKEKKKKAELLKALKKDVKIQTIGGIHGTIDEVKDEDVVLVIDERNKVKITISKAAIASLQS